MTSRPPPQCLSCVHWRPPMGGRQSPTDDPIQICAAYPAGIPDDIWWNRADHRQAVDGDNGIRWEPLDGVEFPDWAMS